MSVKMMTTEQLHQDLASIHNLWPGGIPVEQYDRVNALKAELKRRGADARAIRPDPEAPQQQSLESMTDNQLSAELRTLGDRIGKNPGDETLQEKFANIRFELRKRMSKHPADQLTRTPEVHPQTNGNGTHGESERLVPRHVSPDFGKGVPSDYETDVGGEREKLIAEQTTRMEAMNQVVRKHHLGKCAADVAATILTKYADPNGDDIENACTIGVQVAKNIFDKVGL